MKQLALITALFFAMFIAPSALFSQSQDIKIGIVAVETIFKELPEIQEAEEKMKEKSTKFQDTLIEMTKNLEEKFAAYQKQKGMMTQDQQAQTEQELQLMNQEIVQYREQKNVDLQQFQASLLAPMREKVLKAIREVAKSEKITLVLDKNSPNLLYSEDKYDITFTVLDKIKRGK